MAYSTVQQRVTPKRRLTGLQVNWGWIWQKSGHLIYQALQFSGCKIAGKIPAEGYTFGRSKAMMDGLWLGLPLDEINQPGLSTGRIKRWVGQIRNEFSV